MLHSIDWICRLILEVLAYSWRMQNAKDQVRPLLETKIYGLFELNFLKIGETICITHKWNCKVTQLISTEKHNALLSYKTHQK